MRIQSTFFPRISCELENCIYDSALEQFKARDRVVEGVEVIRQLSQSGGYILFIRLCLGQPTNEFVKLVECAVLLGLVFLREVLKADNPGS